MRWSDGHMKTVLVTGSAGFIGFHVSKKLLERGDRVVGYDNVNKYYDPSLKEDRLRILGKYDEFHFHRSSLEDRKALDRVFEPGAIDKVCHLAAQAGVRYSM